MWSTTTLISGEVESFEVFVLMRLLLGVFSAAANPPALGLIRDYFPKEYRGTANAVFGSNVYIGACVSSLSFLLIEKFGWRQDYDITGAIGIFLGVLVLTQLQEPERGKYDIDMET